MSNELGFVFEVFSHSWQPVAGCSCTNTDCVHKAPNLVFKERKCSFWLWYFNKRRCSATEEKRLSIQTFFPQWPVPKLLVLCLECPLRIYSLQTEKMSIHLATTPTLLTTALSLSLIPKYYNRRRCCVLRGVRLLHVPSPPVQQKGKLRIQNFFYDDNKESLGDSRSHKVSRHLGNDGA